MKEKIRTIPNLIKASPIHQKALLKGDEHFKSWQYNVADHFKDKTVEEIKQSLKDTALPFAVCMEHLIMDYNLGTVIRNANAFNAKEVFYIGDKKRDKRAEVGTSNYTDVHWIPSLNDLVSLKNKYYFVGVDNVPGSISISEYNFKSNTLFIFGEEGVGLTDMVKSLCEDIIHINQFGSVRSLNVGTASGIILHCFAEKFKNNR